MLWEPSDSDQAQEANEKRDKRLGKKTATKADKKFVPLDRILRLFGASDKLTPEKVQELVKKQIDRGANWTKDAMKQMVHERQLVKTIVKHSRGQPEVFYHLPTVLEPAPEDGRPIFSTSGDAECDFKRFLMLFVPTKPSGVYTRGYATHTYPHA